MKAIQTELPPDFPLSPAAADQLMQEAWDESRKRVATKFDYKIEYQNDPIAYSQDVLGISWWSKQLEIARSVATNKRTLVQAAFGVGKTFLAGGLVNWWFDSFPHSISITTAKTFAQVRDVLWKEIASQRKNPPLADATQLRDPMQRDHFAMGFTAGRDIVTDEFGAIAAQGRHAEFLLFVMDEAAGVRPELYATMEDSIVGSENRALLIGNPTMPSGPFYDAARSGSWNVIHISALEHPNVLAGLRGEADPIPGAVSLDWLEDKLNNPYWVDHLGTPSDDEQRDVWKATTAFEFPPGSDYWYEPQMHGEVKILGLFPTLLTDTVWALVWLDEARVRESKWRKSDPLEFGIDVARFGDDASAIHGRRGPVSLLHESWRKEANTATAGRAFNFITETASGHDAPSVIVRVDTTGGHGGGPADILRERFVSHEHVQIVDVDSSQSAYDQKKHPNRRNELWFSAADEYGRTGVLDLTRLSQWDFDNLSSQLTAVRYEMDSHGRLVVWSKVKMKKKTGRSPDDADAFNLAYMGTSAASFAQVNESDDLQKPSTWSPVRQEASRWGTGSSGKGRKWRR